MKAVHPDPAPDFSTGYPSRGKQIGPAWQSLWEWLGRQESGDFHNGHQLQAELSGPLSISRSTVGSLLRKAANSGALERDYTVVNSRKVAYYRRPVAGLPVIHHASAPED